MPRPWRRLCPAGTLWVRLDAITSPDGTRARCAWDVDAALAWCDECAEARREGRPEPPMPDEVK